MKKTLIAVISALLFAGFVGAQSIRVSPEKLKQTGTPLQGAADQSFTVYNSETSIAYYTVSASVDTPSAWDLDPSMEGVTWLSVSPTSGNTTGEFDTITLSYVTTNLPEGKYNGTITVTQTNGTTQSKTIPVVLTINQDENLGIALGPSSAATDESGIAIGSRSARAVAVGADTIQIGGGINTSAGTVGIGSYQLLDSSGVIPAARRGGTLASTTNTICTGLTFNGSNEVVMTVNQVILINGQLTSFGAASTVTNSF